jgi:hypothetical protein
MYTYICIYIFMYVCIYVYIRHITRGTRRPRIPVPGLAGALARLHRRRMSRMRICVEWGFGKLKTLWAFLDWSKKLKIYGSPVARYVEVCGFFTNCHTCLYGSTTSSYFLCIPPTLEEYLI